MQSPAKIWADIRDEGHPWRTFKRKVITNTLGVRPERHAYQKWIQGKLLNIGCGRDYIEGAVNVDNLQVTTYTSYKLKVDFIADACALPSVWADRFDTILASHLWEHQPDPHAFLTEMHRVLKPGGRFIIVVPNYRYMGHTAYYRDPTHLWPFAPAMLEHCLKQDNRWKILQFNKLGRWYKFSIDVVLEKR